MKAFKALAAGAAAAGILFLSACATSTPYQARTSPAGYGYSEQRIEANRFSLSFRGNSVTEREQVENFLLYRAAEITLQQGFDYFVIADRMTDKRSTLESFGPTRPYPYYYFPGRFYSRRMGWAPFYDPFWDDPLNYREITRYEASAEIALFKGPKPANDPHAFDAKEVETNLHGKVTAPPTRG